MAPAEDCEFTSATGGAMQLCTAPNGRDLHDRVFHTLCSAISWVSLNEITAGADAQNVARVAPDGRLLSQLFETTACVVSLHWQSSSSSVLQNNRSSRAESSSSVATSGNLLLLACSDGTVKLVNGSGKLKTSIDAHSGACICACWNTDGTAFVTGGEDGNVKAFSSAGMLRGTLHASNRPVYSLAWSANSAHVALASGKHIKIVNQQPGVPTLEWKAHLANVLSLDWNPCSNLIISGGEDCKYRVWDAQGRALFCSSLLDQMVSSIRWRPDGECFAVGSFNEVLLCDRTGFVYDRKAQTGIGSVFALAWRPDSTRIACACGSGHVACFDVLSSRCQWKHLELKQESASRLHVYDLPNGTSDVLEFKDRVCSFSLVFDRLVVATPSQCFVYGGGYWNTPIAFDIKGVPRLLQQSSSNLLVGDSTAGMQVFSYEGKQLCRCKADELRVELLNERHASISPDVLAVVSTSDRRCIQLFDASQGKRIADSVQHSLDVTEVELSQRGQAADRQLAFMDRNMEVFLARALRPEVTHKVTTMANTLRWHEDAEILAAVADRRLCVWYLPSAAFADRDVLPTTREEQDGESFGMMPTITSFTSSHVTLRRSDGATVLAPISPYPLVLHECCQAFQWAKATRLCRFCKDRKLWASLAAIAVGAMELDTAEVAYAALEEADRLQYIQHVKRVPSKEGRSAEMALFKRNMKEAESILLQAGLVYRAIKMHIELFAWQRALDLAVKYKTHVDTVLCYRRKFLAANNRDERNSRFLQYNNEIGFDEEQVKAKERAELDKEANMPGAATYTPPMV